MTEHVKSSLGRSRILEAAAREQSQTTPVVVDESHTVKWPCLEFKEGTSAYVYVANTKDFEFGAHDFTIVGRPVEIKSSWNPTDIEQAEGRVERDLAVGELGTLTGFKFYPHQEDVFKEFLEAQERGYSELFLTPGIRYGKSLLSYDIFSRYLEKIKREALGFRDEEQPEPISMTVKDDDTVNTVRSFMDHWLTVIREETSKNLEDRKVFVFDGYAPSMVYSDDAIAEGALRFNGTSVSVNSVRALPETQEEYDAFEKVFENLQYASSITVPMTCTTAKVSDDIPTVDGTNCAMSEYARNDSKIVYRDLHTNYAKVYGEVAAAYPHETDDVPVGKPAGISMSAHIARTYPGYDSQAVADTLIKSSEAIKSPFSSGKIYKKAVDDPVLYSEDVDDAILYPTQGDVWHSFDRAEACMVMQVTPRLVWVLVGPEGSTHAAGTVHVLNWRQFNSFMRVGGYDANDHTKPLPPAYNGDRTDLNNHPRWCLMERATDLHGITLRDVLAAGAQYIEHSKL